MKKIIIVNNNLKTGGVQISLLNLLKEIHDKYDITLLLFHADPDDLRNVPSDINIIIEKSPFSYFGMSNQESKRSLKHFFGRSFWAIFTKIFGRSNAIRFMSLFTKTRKDYDCAISYLHEGAQKSFYGGCNEYVLKKVKAKKKITWLHCDFRLCGANNKKSPSIYRHFDTIIACSEGAKNAFVQCLPQFENKCAVVRNCNDFAAIQALSHPKKEFQSDTFNFITVARLSAEKGIDRMMHVLATVKKQGYRFAYHLVGAGQEQTALKQLAESLDISENVIFHGNQTNPYPYIAAADLFVLPSYHEAAPMVFDESASLGIPVLATRTTSADEMITAESAGFVCENSQDGLTSAVLSILQNRNELVSISNHLKEKSFNNQKSIDAVLEIF